MKAAVLFAGPRKKHNTDFLLSHVLQSVEKTGYDITRYDLSDMNIKPCTGCNGCERIGRCVIADDMFKLYDAFDEVDLVIFASPVFFNSVTAIGKAMIDRCQVYWARRFKLNVEKTKKKKLGLFVATMGTKIRGEEFKGSTLVMDIFFKAIDATMLDVIYADGTDLLPVADREEWLEEQEIRVLNLLSR